MPRPRNILDGFLVAALLFGSTAAAQVASAPKPARKAPTPADWAALAKLPDFTGVWEIPLGGGGARGGGGRAARTGGGRAPAPSPSLTPEYAAKAQEAARVAAIA